MLPTAPIAQFAPTPTFLASVATVAIEEDKWTLFSTADTAIFGEHGSSIWHISVASNGDVWIALKNAAAIFDGTKWSIFAMEEPSSGEGNIAMVGDQFVAMPGNRVWMTTSASFRGPGNVFFLNGQEWSPQLEDVRVNRIVEGQGNEVWFALSPVESGHDGFATEGGILRFDGTSWRSYSTEDGLLSNFVLDAERDGWGNMWFSTDKGVSRFDGANWTSYPELRGDLTLDGHGNVWMSYEGGNCHV
jgi:hypothetical protein